MIVSGLEYLRGQSIQIVTVENNDRKNTIEALKKEREKLISTESTNLEKPKVLVK